MNKRRIFEIIQIGKETDFASRAFDFAVLVAILSNLVIAVFSTYEASKSYTAAIYTVEVATVIFFTVEYVLRAWTSQYLYPGYSRIGSFIKYAYSFSGAIDLLSFFPFYLPFFFPHGAVAFRIFRIIRILRLFRINQYYDSLNVITDVLKKKRNQLLSSVFIIVILMIAASLLMYDVEHKAQPEVFENAFSGFWWAAATLFTVGYGDIYPITMAGRIAGIIITFLGVGMVAIPTGILSAGFVGQITEMQTVEKVKYCPRCGKKLD